MTAPFGAIPLPDETDELPEKGSKLPEDSRPAGEATPSKPARVKGLTVAAKNQLQQMHVLIGMGINTWEHMAAAKAGNEPDHLCGNEFITGAENMVAALDKLAEQNPGVRKTLERFASTSAWGAVIAAYSTPALAIVQNHSKTFQRGMARLQGTDVPADMDNPEPGIW